MNNELYRYMKTSFHSSTSLEQILQGVLLVRGQTREFPWFGNFVCLHVEASGKLEKVSFYSRFETAFGFSLPSKLAKQAISKQSKPGDSPG
jgi:hypothetical protein